jgi:hypothetical protein
VDLDVSTLADWVGALAATLKPLRDAIEAHVLRAERIHVDDTTVPVLAKGKCRTGRLWAYVRDDRPFAGEAAPAVLFQYSPTREAEHPEVHSNKTIDLGDANGHPFRCYPNFQLPFTGPDKQQVSYRSDG